VSDGKPITLNARYFARYVAPLGAVLVFGGLVLAFIARFGAGFQYTQTYNYVAMVTPPLFDFESAVISGWLLLTLCLYALMPDLKTRWFSYAGTRTKLRFILAVAGLVIGFSALAISALAAVSKNALLARFATDIGFYMVLVLCAVVGTFLVYVSLFPSARLRHIPVSAGYRVGAFFIALASGALLFMMLEARSVQPSKRQVLDTFTSQAGAPTHAVSAILIDPPHTATIHESMVLELRFRLTEFERSSVANRYPVRLEPGEAYAVSANLRATGFDIAQQPEWASRPILIGPHRVVRCEC
jgi:hypothetical protein